MRRPIERPNNKSGVGTMLLAGVIIIGFGVVGYVFFLGGGLDMGEEEQEAAAFAVERVEPLSEGEVVVRAKEGVEVGVFAAALAVEKGDGPGATRSTGNARKKTNIQIDDIGARSGQARELKGSSPASKPMEKIKELSEQDQEIKRLRELKSKMMKKERKRAEEAVKANEFNSRDVFDETE